LWPIFTQKRASVDMNWEVQRSTPSPDNSNPGYSYEISCARPGWAIISNFWHPGIMMLNPERRNVWMSKITDDGLTRSGTGWFIAVPIWQQKASKG